MSTIARKQAPSSAKRAKKPYTARRLYKSTKRTQRSAGMKYPGVGSKIGSAVGSAFGPAGSLLGGALEGLAQTLIHKVTGFEITPFQGTESRRTSCWRRVILQL